MKRTPSRIIKIIQHINRHMVNDQKTHNRIIYAMYFILKQTTVIFQLKNKFEKKEIRISSKQNKNMPDITGWHKKTLHQLLLFLYQTLLHVWHLLRGLLIVHLYNFVLQKKKKIMTNTSQQKSSDDEILLTVIIWAWHHPFW